MPLVHHQSNKQTPFHLPHRLPPRRSSTRLGFTNNHSAPAGLSFSLWASTPGALVIEARGVVPETRLVFSRLRPCCSLETSHRNTCVWQRPARCGWRAAEARSFRGFAILARVGQLGFRVTIHDTLHHRIRAYTGGGAGMGAFKC